MCDIQNTKACKLLLLSLVLLFAVLPGKLEARPRITNSKTNSVDSPTPYQEISQEDDQVVTSTTPLESEEIVTTAPVGVSKYDLHIKVQNHKPEILIARINQTNEKEKMQDESSKDEIQNEGDVKSIDFRSDNIQTTTFLPTDVTLSDNTDIPFEFPSEKNNVFTILNADDFPILSRKLRGENLGYFENPIKSTDLTYSHVPIEFPTQSNSDIQILYSKDHPIFTNFLTNKNEGRGLSLDLEESSGNFGEKIEEQENKDFIITESVTDKQEINVVTTTEPETISESLNESIESNSEMPQVEKIDNKSSTNTDELILPTNQSNFPVELKEINDDTTANTQTEARLETLGDLYSQKHTTGTSTDEPNNDATDLEEIKLDNFFSTPLPEINSEILLTTISTIFEQNLLESESALLLRNTKDDIGSLVENEEDFWDKKENILNEGVVGRTEDPVNFSKHSIKIIEISKFDNPDFPTDQVRNERTFDNDEILSKSNNSEILTLNSEKLAEEESSTIVEDLSSTHSMEVTAVTTNFPELESTYDSTPKNSLNILKLDDYPDSIKMLSEKSTSNFLEDRGFEKNIDSSNEEENGQFFEPTVIPEMSTEVSYASPEEIPTDITSNQKEDFENTTEIDSLAETKTSEIYPENSVVEHTEINFSLDFESITPLPFDDKKSDIKTVGNDPSIPMIELKNEDHHERNEHVDKIIGASTSGVLLEQTREESIEGFDSEHQTPSLRISVETSVHPREDVASIVDSTLEELEVKHSLKNSKQESNSEDFLRNENDFEDYLQNISENMKTETNNCCTPDNEEQVKIDEDQKFISTTTVSNEEKMEPSSEDENYKIPQNNKDTIVQNFPISQHSNAVKIGFKFDEVSDIITEEETAEKLLKERSKNNNTHNILLAIKPVFEDISTPRGKVESIETNDDVNEVLEPELQPQKKSKLFAVNKKFHSSEETSSSEEHINRDTNQKVVHLNTLIENKSSSESVESYESSYFPSQERFPFKTAFHGRAFSDASEDFTELLQLFKKISEEETGEFVDTDHSVIKKPGAVDSTMTPLILTEETTASPTEKEEPRSSHDDATSTTLPSFTEIIVEAATLTTELNHEIESFLSSGQTTEGVFEETFAAIGSTIPTEVDKLSLGDALPTHDMKNNVVASDISLSAILMICVVAIVVVLALLLTTWYKIRSSGNTFDIQLEEQRHRKDQGSQTISVSE